MSDLTASAHKLSVSIIDEKMRGEAVRLSFSLFRLNYGLNPLFAGCAVRPPAFRLPTFVYAVPWRRAHQPTAGSALATVNRQDQDNQWAGGGLKTLRSQRIAGGVIAGRCTTPHHPPTSRDERIMLLLGAVVALAVETGEGCTGVRTAKGTVSRQQLEDQTLLTLEYEARRMCAF